MQTWNKEFYRFHRKFDLRHFQEIEELLRQHRAHLVERRPRGIETLALQDGRLVHQVFDDFERILGPVGAAKALHLLAPRFYPIWDRKIAVAYEVALGRIGSNSDRYWEFMLVIKKQSASLCRQGFDRNPLKAIDEYNYCKYTRRWID